MCFMSRLTVSAAELKSRFQVDLDEPEDRWQPAMEFSAFVHPKMPVIANNKPDKLQFFEWGLMPSWAKDKSLQNNTLNARIETLHEKPSFRNILNNRCLIPADGFYEWQWLDTAGKKKQKFLITIDDDEIFSFAGLWSTWADFSTGELLETYTIITRPANELMATIHNSKRRMPWILPRTDEHSWLYGNDVVFKDLKMKAEALVEHPKRSEQTLFD
ncbi:MAG TPA: SOS response-associated peptidase [Bacteroidales bacterium]|nr:SOS response-associated peptidase [Bacteroidales bacterium]